ncbi:hypothetical protein K432DRAFT_385544 [Lepidopterella palustris CBS 459.81]|uniref:DUF7907 domain-containing protein n=1 Tax=Lepidopterella palustris CBS 459.81 TaxID=1314670 RepID=A0A8E2E2S4_9PEZI|nr:hypothetical protein K432DRAFT_385544 [Lepidopterella palustris CBS 459.81]
MRFSIIASLFALAASTAVAQYTNQSAPFELVLLSQNPTINGSKLIACHEGAGIEAACRGGSIATSGPGFSTFQFNTSIYSVPTNESAGVTGYLTYELRGFNFNESEPMVLSVDPVSNVALPIFSPSYFATEVAFDREGLMNIQGYVDDRTIPISTTMIYVAYYRWFVCSTYYSGYRYQALTWVLGEFPPENPSCVKVQVKRVFV